MKHVNVNTFKEVLEAEKGNDTVDFINVCTPAEYEENYIEGVRNLPLDEIEKRADELKGKRTVYVHCRTGRRASEAIEKLEKLGVEAELVNVKGGITAWSEAGFTTESDTNRLPIMRQVMIAAGSLVLLGVILSLTVRPEFIYLSAFVGAGLTFAGLSGWCGMSYLLAKMPWNK